MIKEGKVSKEVINFLVQEEDVSLEDEEILLRETKEKRKRASKMAVIDTNIAIDKF